jgi:acyl-coenzyme A thioesterase PaaI-like protein
VNNPIGLKLIFNETAPGEVMADVSLPEKYQGYPGMVHGGIVAAMLDEIAGRALMGGNPPRFMYTARMDIHYRSNVPIGEPLRLIGRVGKIKNRTATATGTLYNAEGDLLAEAEVLLVNVPENTIEGVNLSSLGWRVYSDEELNIRYDR